MMKRSLLQSTRFSIIGLCCLLSMNSALHAQNYFSLTDISINPAAPNNYQEVSISLSGLRQDSCTTLNFFDASILLYNLGITMDWDSIPAPVCNGTMIPWDTTIILGVLPDGAYTIDLMGTHFSNDSGDPLSFVVSELPAGICGTNGIIWVNNIDDEGPGSLRNAINCVNNNAGIFDIYFDIPGSGPHILRVGEVTGEPLPPVISGGITIDGTTQPGFGPNGPAVVLTGRYGEFTTPESGLTIQGSNCAIYGLEITEFPDNGILLDGPSTTTIGSENGFNIITKNGVSFESTNVPNNYQIGAGIRLINGATHSSIDYNYIGTNLTQEQLGNEYCGIFIQQNCDDNTIGGNEIGSGNTIAHNTNGIRVEDGADFNEFVRNHFSCNDSIAIKNVGSANSGQPAPSIDLSTYHVVSGYAIAGNRVDVYINRDQCFGAPCQGDIFLGEAFANGMGEWTLNAPFANGDTLSGGEVVTAIATDTDGSSSEFANCQVVTGLSACSDPGGVIWVTNAQDTGIGSLREAMLCANSTSGANTIQFNIPGTGPFTIYVGADSGQPLPAIIDAGTIIDATTQPGFGMGGDYSPMIILSGAQNTWNSPDDALKITASYTEIYGLEIVDFPDDAIEVLNAVDVTIGAPLKGNVIYNNGAATDFFPSLPGQGPFEGSGIALRGVSKRVNIHSNYIGTDYNQTNTNGNEYCGIFIGYDIDFIHIGGSAGKGNVIANNAEGIRVQDESFGIQIRQNSFICNDTVAIRLEGVSSGDQQVPTWNPTSQTSLTNLSGQADAGDAVVEVFRVDNGACSAAPCQGKTYLGTAIVSNNEWTLNAPFANGVTLSNGDLLVATAIDFDGNTSEFSECHIAANCALMASGIGIVNATCNLPNGSFTIATSGGPAPYTFDRGLGPQASATFTNLPAGTYSISVTDAYTCPTTTSVTITDPGLPTTSPQIIEEETCDMQNGFVVMNQGSGGTGPYSYNIGNGNQPNNPNFINLSAGNYNVTITDANNCTNAIPVTIPFIPAPTLAVPTIENETCGSANGSFTASVTMGGTPIFNYSIGGGSQTNPFFSGLPAGVYTVTVTDDNGCTDTESVTLTNVPGPSQLTVVGVNPDYCGQNTGGVTVSPTGGTAPYLYDIGFGQDNSATFTNLPGDNYSVTVTDFNNCTAVATVNIPQVDGATLSVASSSDANCGQASGSVTISATNGSSPYLYNIGNGNQSSSTFSNLLAGGYEVSVTDANNCVTTLAFTINDLGGPTPSISALSDATCEEANGSVTILATGGQSPFIYNIGNGATGNPMLTNLAAGNYTVTVTDAANCSSVLPVTIGNVGLQPVSSFTYTETDGTVSFTSTAQNAGAYSWDFGNGGGSSAANPVHTYSMDGTYNVCLTAINDCGQDISCQMLTIQTTIGVSGIIEKENGVPVANVKIHYGGPGPAISNTDGTYTFDIPSGGGNTILTPDKDTLYGNGVSGFDVFKIQRHILIVEPLDSPYKIIAADVNHSNTVTTFDTYLMQQVILQNVDTFPNNTSWRFVVKDYVFPVATNPFAATFPEAININNATTNVTDADFIAIKIGDVTLDANPAIMDNPPSDKMAFLTKDLSWEREEDLLIPVRVNQSTDLAALQCKFRFDASVLTFEGIQSGGLPGLDEQDFNAKKAHEGLLSMAWYDKSGLGQQLEANTLLFYLRFKAKTAGQLSEALHIQPYRSIQTAYTVNGHERTVELVFEKEIEQSEVITAGYKLAVQPNPFSEFVQVLLEMPVTEYGEIAIFDVSGRQIYHEELLLEKGLQQIRIGSEHFDTKGIYLLQIKTEGFVETQRVLFN